MKKTRIIFAGTPFFSVPTLKALLENQDEYEVVAVYTQPDRKSGRGQKLTASPVKNCALEHSIPVFQPINFKSESSLAELKALNADIMVVVAYGLLLPKTVLDSPTIACINVHASLLPRWRGAAPIQRAILAGDQQTGVCIMQMEEGLDTGPVYSSTKVPITNDMNSAQLHDLLSLSGSKLLIQTLPGIIHQTLIPIKQDESIECTYAHKLDKAEAKLNFHQPSYLVERQIRAFNPFPGAFALLNEKKIKIWQAKLSNIESPKDIIIGGLFEEQRKLFVRCLDGCLEICHLQLEGKKASMAQDFLQGYHLQGTSLI